MDAIDVLFARRSTGRLTEPGPTAEDLDLILRAAGAAPDHEALRPWRFVVLAGEAKEAFGTVLAEAYDARCAAAGTSLVAAKREKELTKLGRAPVVVTVGCVPVASRVPEVEQIAAASAAAQNALLAATALGFGSMWRTGDPCYDEHVKRALGLGPTDHLLGFLYLGTVRSEPLPPNEPDLDGLVSTWRP